MPFRVLALLVATLVSSTASAEVMDKEPPVFALWAYGIAHGLAGLVGWPFFRPVAILAAVHGALWFAGFVSEVRSPDVGPAILREAGPTYVVHGAAACAVFIALQLAGITLWMRRRKLREVLDA
jgi:hypothetical protein